jgi:hypothetical protein
MVVRFVWAWSIWAQKPKSAVRRKVLELRCGESRCVETLTEFDVTFHRKQDVIGLDISMYDTFRMQMLQSLQCLSTRQHTPKSIFSK